MSFTYTTRKDGRLMKRVSINGRIKTIYSDNPKDLEKQYIDLKYKSNNHLATDTSNITFEQYAEKWFILNMANKEEATQKSVRVRLNHMYRFIAPIKLVNLKPFHIQEIITTMQSEGLKDITNRTLMDCNRILEDAVINDVISKNVARGIKKIKYAKGERRPLTLEEDRKVYQCALNHKYGSFILLLRYCGVRPEEAVALTIKDIDFKNKILIVNKAVSLAQNQPKVKPTKNLKNRKIPIPNFLIDILKEDISKCNENGSQYIFTKESDNLSMLTKQALRSHLNTFLNVLNKNSDTKIHFTYYQLRHSYCTMLYYSGIKIKKAQELMRSFFCKNGL